MNQDPQDIHEEPTVQEPVATPIEAPVVAASPGMPSWYRHVSTIIFIIFCFEMGLFLVVFPWLDPWSQNYFSMIAPGKYLPVWRQFWNSAYFRGAVSGFGLVNIWIALQEVFGMFSRKAKE